MTGILRRDPQRCENAAWESAGGKLVETGNIKLNIIPISPWRFGPDLGYFEPCVERTSEVGATVWPVLFKLRNNSIFCYNGTPTSIYYLRNIYFNCKYKTIKVTLLKDF